MPWNKHDIMNNSNNQNGKGNRSHQNVSNPAYREGYDNIKGMGEKFKVKKVKKKIWQAKSQLL